VGSVIGEVEVHFCKGVVGGYCVVVFFLFLPGTFPRQLDVNYVQLTKPHVLSPGEPSILSAHTQKHDQRSACMWVEHGRSHLALVLLRAMGFVLSGRDEFPTPAHSSLRVSHSKLGSLLL
jgi:hypothetical protein